MARGYQQRFVRQTERMIYPERLTSPVGVGYLVSKAACDGGPRIGVTPVATKPTPTSSPEPARRKPIPQTDIPSVPLEEALRVPRALGDDYAFNASTPLDVARSVRMQPGSGPFRNLVGAAAAYGLTEGSAWAEKIAITPIGRRVIRPTVDGDDRTARREAFLKPRVTGGFLKDYDGSKVPREEIARNVLAEKFAIPATETGRVFKQIIEDARRLGLLTDIEGTEYVQLVGSPGPNAAPTLLPASTHPEPSADDAPPAFPAAPAAKPAATSQQARKMYLSHGSNKAFVELLKELCGISEMEGVVTEQRDTAAVPLPEKFTSDMRQCGSAIIHVDAERTLTDADNAEHVILNENVLIEIGAAMALYDKRFILLVRDGIKLPSNLHGLYEVRYTGDTLDAATALKLLGSIKDIKSRPMPA